MRTHLIRCYFVQKDRWLMTGWRLLQAQANYQRDFSMPQNNYRGCARTEFVYNTGFAHAEHVQHRGVRIFTVRVSQYRTPHSGKNFLPSATAALGYSKGDRDIFWSWSVQVSDQLQEWRNSASRTCSERSLAAARTHTLPS